MADRENMGENIDPGIIARVQAGIKYMITGVGPSNFFGPQQPLPPVAQETQGRAFDYPVGVNLRIPPRNTEMNPFSAMRQLADGYDLLRVVIETRKDQIKSFEWEIVPKDEKATAEQYADEIKRVTEFLERPDREHAWDDWLSMLIEDLLVIDAVAVHPRLNRGGKVMSLELIDAATITRKIDETGRTPLPPDIAYQQILHGIMANDLTSDQLVYMMRNPRTSRLYGFSPVEQIMMTVNIALRRQITQLEFYTSGNVPEAIAQVPDSWTPKNIAEFQILWDSMNEGNLSAKRKMRFVPKLDGIVFPKQDILKDEFDEWLARIVCFAFSISPTAFVKQMNRATAEQSADTAKEEGLMPLMRWLQNKMNHMVQYHLGAQGVKFKWKIENAIDPKVQSDVDVAYIGAKVVTSDEVRERLGYDALTPEAREKAWPTPVAPEPVVAEDKTDKKPVDDTEEKQKDQPKPEADKVEDVQKMFHIEVHPPTINLGDTLVRVAGAEPSPVSVHIDPQHITLNPAEAADVNLQMGDVIVQADMRATPAETKTVGKREVRAERQPDGSLIAKMITVESEHTVKGEPQADGSTLAKIDTKTKE